MRDDGLTDQEGAVMDALMDAVDAYSELDVQHPDEAGEFIQAIHRLQDLLAVRLCRRLYPEGWVTYGPQEDTKMQNSPPEGCEAARAGAGTDTWETQTESIKTTSKAETEGEAEDAQSTFPQSEAA